MPKNRRHNKTQMCGCRATSAAAMRTPSSAVRQSRSLPTLCQLLPALRRARSSGAHLRAHLRPKRVDHGQALRRLDVPEGPAVASFQPLRQSTDAMDRADSFAERERAVGADQRAMAAFGVNELDAGSEQAALDQRRERYARCFTRG